MTGSLLVKPLKAGWVEIGSPLMNSSKELSFKEKRQVYSAVLRLENLILANPKLKGWVTWTKLENKHIMRLLHRVGALPYGMTNKRMYFLKSLKETSECVDQVEMEETAAQQ